MRPMKLCRLLLSSLLVLPGLGAAWNDTPIEAELAATQTYLAIIDVGPDRTAGALIKLPDLGGDELVKIDFKPEGRESSLFRFYWLRNGELELFREYDWASRGNLADFERKSERVIRFEHGTPTAPEGGSVPSDSGAILREGKRLYRLLEQQGAE